MNLAEIREKLRSSTIEDVTREIMHRDPIAVFPTTEKYATYRERVKTIFPNASVYVMGSANLGYSLSPDRFGGSFNQDSDIDLVLVSAELFMGAWEDIRLYHRENFYQLDQAMRLELRRKGENVYSGFASPKFIPSKIARARRDFEFSLNRLSDDLVNFRKVSAYFFRNEIEAIDYYKRSIRGI